ncbi:MAG TPA: transposase [Polyangiaceae bacterium]
MANAANLVEHVLPERAPLRQFALTLPFELRARLAYDGKLLGAVCHAFVDSVLGWYQRHFKARDLGGGKSGAVTAVQRVSSDLRLNPHFHTLALDGVYNEDEHGKLVFHPLPCLTNGDVADILQIASSRILRLLRRSGVVEDDAVNADESLADSEPIPPPHFHTVRYAGVLAAASPWRARVVPPPKPLAKPDPARLTARPAAPRTSPPPTARGIAPGVSC